MLQVEMQLQLKWNKITIFMSLIETFNAPCYISWASNNSQFARHSIYIIFISTLLCYLASSNVWLLQSLSVWYWIDYFCDISLESRATMWQAPEMSFKLSPFHISIIWKVEVREQKWYQESSITIIIIASLWWQENMFLWNFHFQGLIISPIASFPPRKSHN